ncbi:acyltransferase family protein [uncultured Mailhella sp.]|uniref:acyltransferase family protein n=1 Tax=uncultured Mailhella sp. TaxID=1981031 RepID=UPI00261613E1|nr:acyltransferase family protein [uncultured Mailhella sp.]
MLMISYIPVILLGEFKIIPDTLNLMFISHGMGFIKTWPTNHASWFICVLFFTLPIFFFMLANYKTKNVLFSCSIIAIFAFCAISRAESGFPSSAAIKSLPFLTNGVVRALGGISVGILLGYCLKTFSPPKILYCRLFRILFTVIEITLLCVWIQYMSFHKPAGETVFFQILFIAIFVLFLYQFGYFSSLINRKCLSYLGTLSYPIYLLHFPAFHFLKKYILIHCHQLNEFLILFIIMGVCMGFAVLAQLFYELCVRVFARARAAVSVRGADV